MFEQFLLHFVACICAFAVAFTAVKVISMTSPEYFLYLYFPFTIEKYAKFNLFYFILGSPYTAGVVSRKKLVITTDSPVITNLRQAGIVPYIKTNISELCLWYESSNKVYGQTNNAYDSTRIVGGSSGTWIIIIHFVSYIRQSIR